MAAKTAEDLNGFEMMELKKVLGTSIDRADGTDTVYALVYVFKKREDANYTHNDALGMTFKDAMAYLGLNDEDEPVADPFADDANDPKD